jgi:hypothetical protein
MTGRCIIFRRAKSIAGASLIGFGLFILYQNLAAAMMMLRHALGVNGSETLGIPLAVIQTASQVLEIYTANHQQFLENFLHRMLVSSWPLLLVIAGTVLSRDSFLNTSTHCQEKMAD